MVAWPVWFYLPGVSPSHGVMLDTFNTTKKQEKKKAGLPVF